MSNELEWENPPSRGASGLDHLAIASELRTHPGKWAKITRTSQKLAADIRRGVLVAYRPVGAFEAVSRNGGFSDNGSKTRIADIYVRYVGDDSQ
jgi:hypothetical protein